MHSNFQDAAQKALESGNCYPSPTTVETLHRLPPAICLFPHMPYPNPFFLNRSWQSGNWKVSVTVEARGWTAASTEPRGPEERSRGGKEGGGCVLLVHTRSDCLVNSVRGSGCQLIGGAANASSRKRTAFSEVSATILYVICVTICTCASVCNLPLNRIQMHLHGRKPYRHIVYTDAPST